MSPRSSSSRTGRKTPSDLDERRTQTNIQIGSVVLFVVLVIIFLATGKDPLSLFDQGTEQPVESSAPTTVGASRSSEWWFVYFTDPLRINDPNDLGGSIEERLIEYINGAQRTIHIAAFEFNLTPVAEALVAAHQRGVEVRWVTDDENGLEADSEEDRGQFAMLEEAGIEVRDDGREGFMHNKFWIFDGETVWTGSTNATVNDIFRNNNNVIIFHSPEIAVIYEREFAEMWAGEFGPTSPSTVDMQLLTVGRTPLEFYFASEDETISHLLPLVQNAQESIYFMAFSFTHDELMQAMLERAAAGVVVQGIFETRGSETEYSALPPLYCAGLPVRQDGNPGTFHHKVIIIDGEVVVTGSLNFSSNADESNDENTVVITSRGAASLFMDEFVERWDESVEPDPAMMNCR